ncbi:MAG: methionyl-tRNA formyltransferase [Ignavibacteriae bacterium]|nr:methionyl-tRNA formyltransferase [Ignavibacteriota bacterium]MCB9217096.1 methionyl-tRNA formyltransferase [Ignavibacteria bacterium]
MGTPEFAIPSLEGIVEAGYTVPLVVTVPDKPKGRGRSLSPSPVKVRAEELGLPVATPESLRNPEFLEQLRAANPDVVCVVAFRILPEEVYTIPSKGSFNLHGSLLPKYRGAAPINRAIMAGESETGVTTFFLKSKVDTGDVILKRSIEISPDMTAGELHDEMMVVGREAVIATLRLIEAGDVVTMQQDDAEASPAPKIFREDCVIDWRKPAAELHNHIRGLSPYPGAFTFMANEQLKVLRSSLTNGAQSEIGLLRVEGDRLFVGTGSGELELLEVQRAGKRRMTVADFLKGVDIEKIGVLGSTEE